MTVRGYTKAAEDDLLADKADVAALSGYTQQIVGTGLNPIRVAGYGAAAPSSGLATGDVVLLPDPSLGVDAPFWTPPKMGLIAWSYDISNATLNTQPTAGTLSMVRLPIPAATTVTNVILAVATAGSGLTSGQCFAGLFNSSRVLLSSTADQSTSWNSTGAKIMPLAAAQAVTPGDYFVGFFYNGTTAPAFARAASAPFINLGLSTANSRYATADTGRTTSLPATAATLAAGTIAYWVGVS